MNTVKGSKQYHLRVVPHRPLRRIASFLLALALVAGVMAASYFAGLWQGGGVSGTAATERDRLQQSLGDRDDEVESLRQQVTNLTLAARVDQQASEEVRGEVIELRQQIAALEADITFYRGLMAPGDDGQGLSIGEVNILATDVPGHYQYKMVVQQLATNHQVLNGTLKVNVVGRRDGAQMRVPLYQLSEDLETEEIRLRFKYFQNIEGELVVPEGFTPERLELVAASTGANNTQVEKSFGWLVQN